jgi:hypothetical protein
VLKAAKSSELHAYVVVSLTTGIRTEEARALRRDHVVALIPNLKSCRPVTEAGFNHKTFAIYVWRADREGGDTKTRKSRRTLELPKPAAQALRHRHTRQAVLKLKAGRLGKITTWGSARASALHWTPQAGDHQRCPDDAHHLRRQPTRVENPSELAPRLAPIDFQT